MTIQRIDEDGNRFDVPPGLRVLVTAGQSLHNTSSRPADLRVIQHGIMAADLRIEPDDMHQFETASTVVVPLTA